MIGYVRVSKPSSRDTEKDEAGDIIRASLVAQRQQIEYACRFHGWLIDRWEEDVLSARNMDRPGLQRALASCEAGESDGIVVAKLDRLSRSVLDFERLMVRAQDQDWRIAVADGNINLGSADGRYMARALLSASQHEREKVGERTAAVLSVKKASGVVLGRKPSIPPQIRSRIEAMRADGLRDSEIAAILNGEGVPTPRGGVEWRASSLASV